MPNHFAPFIHQPSSMLADPFMHNWIYRIFRNAH